MAIAGSFLIGLGFAPFQAATLCLVANTAPVAWGGVGNPIRVLAGVTGLPETALSAMTGRILPPLSPILPLWLVRSMVGWRETPGRLAGPGRQRPLLCARLQFYWSNYQESGLVDVVAALFSLLVMVGVPEDLAAARRSSPTTGRAPDDELRSTRHSLAARAQGLVPLPARLGLHLPVRPAAGREYLSCFRPQAADARAPPGRPPRPAGGERSRRRKTRSRT